MPHPINKKIKRASRLVILPDYQGIGLGIRFFDVVAEYYHRKGFDFSVIFSSKNLLYALKKNKKWVMTRLGTFHDADWGNKSSLKDNWKVRKVKTATFFYVGDKK